MNCTSDTHDSRDCRSPYRCKTCNKSGHHTLLHKTTVQANEPAARMIGYQTSTKSTPMVSIEPTLELQAESSEGLTTKVTALYDSGATITLISNQVANRLKLRKRKSDVTIQLACGDTHMKDLKMVQVKLNSPHVQDSDIYVEATVVPMIGYGRNRAAIQGSWPFLDQLQLADPNFRQGKKLDIILGANALAQIKQEGCKRGKNETPVAELTKWGWIVWGDVPALVEVETHDQQICQLSLTKQLLQAQANTDKYLEGFFACEELPDERLQNLEDEKALQHYSTTHTILKDGRFQVELPCKTDHNELGESRQQAVKRYISNERSLIRKDKLQPYQEVVREYFALKHAEHVPATELERPPGETYYLPMHAVFKESSTSTKLRVVFDASAATSNGISLNDTLLIGPTVYPLLTEIIIRFRQHNIAITADISKMFREIVLAPNDRDLHRFIWRDKPGDQIEYYRMTRVTFGVTCSPFLATQTLQQIAENVKLTHPLASNALKKAFYVDDLITGTDTHTEAQQLRVQLQRVLDDHGLNLKKWRTNSQVMMSSIPKELHEKETGPKPFGETDYLKTLGIHWNSTQDEFHVSISELELPAIITKRILTSDVAKTFDVLGWFSPTTTLMKMAIQQLWGEKTDWDERVSDHIQSTWTEWRNELPTLAARPVPRPYFTQKKRPLSVQLHGFSDASLKAYAGVVYVRAVYKDGPPTVALVTAKTKVSPLKGSTVPRLELCGAELLSKLMNHTRKTLDIPLDKVHCWIDSTIVLHWLDKGPKPLKTYVENRVRRSLENVPLKHWKHVPGIENPADCASRGVFPSTLVNHRLWWHGPPWLQHEPFLTPPQPTLMYQDKSEANLKETKTVSSVSTQDPPWMISRYSSYHRLRRCVAWSLRFAANSKLKKPKRELTPRLTTEDIVKSEAVLIHQAQLRAFPDGQIEKWKKDKRTRALNPMIDAQGLIRVNGRLGNSQLAYAQRFPLILHGTDPFTRLIIKQEHLSNGHAGPTLLMSSLGRTYFLIQGMTVVKAICRNCVTCKRFRAQTESQLMGQLPPYRVTPGFPFQSVGTDFAGPITTKRGYTRKPAYDKTYVCVFVCLTTKAVHLKTVSDLTTAAFVACLDRFIGRRGKPLTIHSDNRSNFRGAARELEEVYELMRTPEMQETTNRYCTNERINWQFNPARAPHFGGIWEAAVKSFKYHLRRVTNKIILNFEELNTVLIKIEAALNSRPLLPLHAHSTEGLNFLTPGHFLVGRPLTARPDGREETTKLTPNKRYQLCRQLNQHFWRSWSQDYLRQLHARTKWQKPSRNVQVDDVVLIREETAFRANDWPLARVIRVHTGRDGLVRAVDVQANGKTYCRPIAKLTVLFSPTENEEEFESGTTGIPVTPLSPAGMSELVTTPSDEIIDLT